MLYLHNFSWFARDESDITQKLNERSFQQLDNANQKQQPAEDRMGQEYLLLDGTPTYKFFNRNPYGG